MEPYMGQLLLGAWNLVPKGFAACNGQLLGINSNQALFSLIGTYYGGNGIQTFALPNLQGRAPMSFGNSASGSYTIGENGGEEMHTLLSSEVPPHVHALQGTTAAATASKPPTSNLLAATSGGATIYAAATGTLSVMNASTISFVGGNQPHENRQPYLVMNWVIALVGIFPSRN